MSCLEIRKGCKAADGVQPFGFNWAVAFARSRRPNHPYAAAVAARPAGVDAQTGFEYVSSGGVSSSKTTLAFSRSTDTGRDETPDGSLVWTTQAMSFSSLAERIQSVEWEAPAGLTLSDEVIVDQPAYQGTLVTIAGGVVGRTYDVEVHVVTTLGNHYDAILRLSIV